MVTELRKIKYQKYHEIESELNYLEEQKQLFRKIHKKDDGQSSSFEENEEQEKPGKDKPQVDFPWFLVEALSDETSNLSSVEDPREIAEDILEEGRKESENAHSE